MKKKMLLQVYLLCMTAGLSGCGALGRNLSSEAGESLTAQTAKDAEEEQETTDREELEPETTQNQEPSKEVWLPVSEITVNTRGSYREFSLEYDSQGFLAGGMDLVSVDTAERADAESCTLEFTCDEDGRPTEMIMTGEDGTRSTVRYSYDEEGMLTSMNGGGFRSSFSYEYDAEGRVSTRTHLGADGSVSGYRVFTYDDAGNILSQTRLTADGETDDRYSYTFLYEYEENGLVSRRQMYCESELIFDTTYIYELIQVPESFDETQPYAVSYIDSSITY